MAVKRKGVLYLLLSLFLVGVMLTLIFAMRLPTADERNEALSARLVTMNDFLRDFHQDIHRATFISAFRSLIAIEQYIDQEGDYLTAPGSLFIEAFMNGTINDAPFEVLENSTFSDYLQRVNYQAVGIGLNLDAAVENVSLTQSTPWSVDVTLLMTVNVTDTRGLARWDYQRNFTTEVSILDLRDPVYSVSTFGRVPNTIRISPTNMSAMVSGNDTTKLFEEIRGMYYREDPYAPSFLQRLAGNLTGTSKYGIASIVDLDELNAQSLPVLTTKATHDYLYFSNATTTNYCADFGTPLQSWFKIDAQHYNDHLRNYELDDLNATVC
jgi:hypothetical protein